MKLKLSSIIDWHFYKMADKAYDKEHNVFNRIYWLEYYELQIQKSSRIFLRLLSTSLQVSRYGIIASVFLWRSKTLGRYLFLSCLAKDKLSQQFLILSHFQNRFSAKKAHDKTHCYRFLKPSSSGDKISCLQTLI